MPRLLPLALALLLAPSALAQAWTPRAGDAYAKLSLGLTTASERYDAGGEAVPFTDAVAGGAYRDRSLYLYTEAGLTDRLALVAALPFKRVAVDDVEGAEEVERTENDFGTLRLGFRLGIADLVGLDARSALAVQVGAGLPLGYRRNLAPTAGPGQVDLELQAAYGRSFHPLPAYAQARLGYRLRTAAYGLSRTVTCSAERRTPAGEVCVPDAESRVDFGDELLFGLEAGWTFGERLLVQGLLDGIWSVSAPEPPAAGSAAGQMAPLRPEAFARQRVVRVGGGATLTLSGIGLSAQAFTALHARNALRATQLFLGVERKFGGA